MAKYITEDIYVSGVTNKEIELADGSEAPIVENKEPAKEEGIFVTFGDNAPDTLKDFCYSIDVNPEDAECLPGTICMEKAELPTLDIGSTIAITK